MSWREYDLQGISLTRRLLTPHLVHFPFSQLLPQREAETMPDYRYPVVASTEVGAVETGFKEIHLLPHSADYETLARSSEFAAVKAALLELDRLVRAQGGHFLVVYVPSKEHVLLYHFADPHWNQAGNELAADTIYEYVLSR